MSSIYSRNWEEIIKSVLHQYNNCSSRMKTQMISPTQATAHCKMNGKEWVIILLNNHSQLSLRLTVFSLFNVPSICMKYAYIVKGKFLESTQAQQISLLKFNLFYSHSETAMIGKECCFMTSSNISSSSTSFSFPCIVAALALLALDIFEPIVGDVGSQMGATEPLTGEEAPVIFLVK